MKCIGGAILDGKYDNEDYGRHHPGIGSALSELLKGKQLVNDMLDDLTGDKEIDIKNTDIGLDLYAARGLRPSIPGASELGDPDRSNLLVNQVWLNTNPARDWRTADDSIIQRDLLHELSHASVETDDTSGTATSQAGSFKNAHAFETLASGNLCDNSVVLGLIRNTGKTCCCPQGNGANAK